MKNNIELTNEQQQAFNTFKDWLEDENSPYFTLSGYAGTGKTTLLDFFVGYAARDKSKDVVVTATTNKAVKVLRSKVEPLAEFSTIHSLLAIRPKRKGTKEIFESVFNEDVKINRFDLIIVDECSMVSEQLFSLIENHRDSKVKVLFSGDPAQLPPIGEKSSKTFNFDGYKLENIIRHGNTIAEKASLFRDPEARLPSVDRLIVPGTIDTIPQSRLLSLFKNWEEGIDSCRLLAWRNKTVTKWNYFLRSRLHPSRHKEIDVGDILMAMSPATENKFIILNNSEEVLVKRVKENEEYWKLTCSLVEQPKVEKTLRKVKKSYSGTLEKLLRSHASNKHWNQFWNLKDFYHDLDFCYSLTTHKSQGSTYKNVVIDVKDIYANWEKSEVRQLMYVAMTRASERIYFLT